VAASSDENRWHRYRVRIRAIDASAAYPTELTWHMRVHLYDSNTSATRPSGLSAEIRLAE
jgi:hypothetical protein